MFCRYLNRFDDDDAHDCTKRKGKTNRATKERSTWTEMKKSLAEKEADEFKSIGLGTQFSGLNNLADCNHFLS